MTKCKSLLTVSAAVAAFSSQASTDYPPAIWHAICNANWYTSGYGHKFHVCHDMEGYYASTIAWFDNCSMSSASVHYAVNGKQDATSDASPGEITQLGVREANYAWHARCWNQHSTGTEHEGFASNPAWYTDAQYQASAGLTRHLASKFGFAKDRNHIVGHNEWQRSAWRTYAAANLGIDPNCNSHTDPGAYWDWSKYMAMVNGTTTMGPAMFYDLGNGAMNIYRWSSSGSAYSLMTVTGIASGYSLSQIGSRMAASDVDGDGASDNVVAYQYTDGTMHLHVFMHGSSYQGPTGWFQSGQFNLANVAGRMVGGDFNGDGLGDVALIYDNGGGVSIYRFLSTGSAFTYDVASITSGYDLSKVGNNVAAADVNNDGKTDIVTSYQYPDGTMRLHVFINGNSYAGATGWYQSGAYNLNNVAGRMVGGDFNGDGKDDIAQVYDNGNGSMTIHRFLSTGTAFSHDSFNIASGYSLVNVGENVAAGDSNGDGKADIVMAYQYADGTMRLHLFPGGNSYAGPTGWYQSGQFNMGNVAGRMTMGYWGTW